MLEVSSLSMFNTVKAFRCSLLMTDQEYIFIFHRVESNLSEEQFVARVHKAERYFGYIPLDLVESLSNSGNDRLLIITGTY